VTIRGYDWWVRLDDITIDGPYDVRAHAQGAAAAKRAEIKKAGFPYKGRLTVYGTDAKAYGTGEDVLEVTEAVHPVRMEPLETVWANESGRHALPLETAWEAYERNKALMLKAFEGGALASDASDFQAAFAASRRLQREYTDPGDPYKGSETEPLVPMAEIVEALGQPVIGIGRRPYWHAKARRGYMDQPWTPGMAQMKTPPPERHVNGPSAYGRRDDQPAQNADSPPSGQVPDWLRELLEDWRMS